jgi:hypothetical protein
MDADAMWGALTNYGAGAAFEAKITFRYYRVWIRGECFVVDARKTNTFPYMDPVNQIPASPSHIQPRESAKFLRLPTPIVVDYDRTISRSDSVVQIDYMDSFNLSHRTFQKLAVWTEPERIKQQQSITMTFGEEIIGAKVDSSVFGPPETAPMTL